MNQKNFHGGLLNYVKAIYILIHIKIDHFLYIVDVFFVNLEVYSF